TWLCSTCKTNLPITHFHQLSTNPITQIFAGRIPLIQASSFFYFVKESAVQHLLHALKYNYTPKLGTAIGEWYGEELTRDGAFETIDSIVPIPLHYAKQQQRGYNQSTMFAMGLAHLLHKPLDDKSVLRNMATTTQTKKNRAERWENVADVFSLQAPEMFRNKHILLVDDVVTTGATLEACANKILQVEGASVSIATIAFAKL
ncbi:MAG: phosphoribosyltransferase family protein, partial [Bacteroidetes bacterium]|nr:phosphoribosyltransferase family protein [Bacteroidota bacterium]